MQKTYSCKLEYYPGRELLQIITNADLIWEGPIYKYRWVIEKTVDGESIWRLYKDPQTQVILSFKGAEDACEIAYICYGDKHTRFRRIKKLLPHAQKLESQLPKTVLKFQLVWKIGLRNRQSLPR